MHAFLCPFCHYTGYGKKSLKQHYELKGCLIDIFEHLSSTLTKFFILMELSISEREVMLPHFSAWRNEAQCLDGLVKHQITAST